MFVTHRSPITDKWEIETLIELCKKQNLQSYNVEAFFRSRGFNTADMRYVADALEADGLYEKADIIRNAVSEIVCETIVRCRALLRFGEYEGYLASLNDTELDYLTNILSFAEINKEEKARFLAGISMECHGRVSLQQDNGPSL